MLNSTKNCYSAKNVVTTHFLRLNFTHYKSMTYIHSFSIRSHPTVQLGSEASVFLRGLAVVCQDLGAFTPTLDGSPPMTEMSPLRRRMIEDMTVRNLSPATQRSYVHAVAKFGRFFSRSPEKLGLEEVADTTSRVSRITVD